MPSHSDEDFIIWPDGTVCAAADLPSFAWKSDDYERVPFDTGRWYEVQAAFGTADTPEPHPAEAWRDAVLDAMVCWDMAPPPGETPRQSLNRLLALEQRVTLDPAVSREAAALIERGRQEAFAETIDPARLSEIADRRDALCRRPPRCPKCDSPQVQLRAFDDTTAIWRCRTCRPKVEWETTDA